MAERWLKDQLGERSPRWIRVHGRLRASIGVHQKGSDGAERGLRIERLGEPLDGLSLHRGVVVEQHQQVARPVSRSEVRGARETEQARHAKRPSAGLPFQDVQGRRGLLRNDHDDFAESVACQRVEAAFEQTGVACMGYDHRDVRDGNRQLRSPGWD